MGPMRGQRDALAADIGHGDAGAARVVGGDGAVVPELARASASPPSQSARSYAVELLAIGLAYFVFAKIGLALASIHPSASPIWPPTGLALAAVMLRGYRVWPAIFLGAWLANATTAGSVYTSSAIALGNTLESLVGGYLISRWSDGLRTFDTPAGVARFALIALVAATPISATIGVGSLALAGYADPLRIASTWLTWWLGDLAGALVITPVIVLWAQSSFRSGPRRQLLETGAVIAAAAAVGLLAFSPLIDQTPNRDPLGFLAVLPLMWAALRRGQRDTATVALVLSGFALWGAMSGEGPFARSTLNDSLLLLIMYMISTSVPTLALSADVAVHKRTERNLREAHAAAGPDRAGADDGARGNPGGAASGAEDGSARTIDGRHRARLQQRPHRDHQFSRSRRAPLQIRMRRPGSDWTARCRPPATGHRWFSRCSSSLADIRCRCRPPTSTRSSFQPWRCSAAAVPKSIEIRTDLAPDLHWATADATQVQTAILNLAVNARDAMPAGGRLTIATRNLPGAAQLPAGLPPGEYISIAVTDTGEGMSPEVLARAFEPFFTTKEIGKGTGLGLSMVYSTMRQMGGDIEIDSRPGEGTTVRLMLPVAAPPRLGCGHRA